MTQTPLQRKLVRLASAINAKALRLGAAGRVSAQELAQLIVEAESRCSYCGIDLEPLDVSFDHVIAFKVGGVNRVENILPCCMTCQRTKYTKNPEQLAVWQALRVTCPVDGKVFRPRWADWTRGLGKYCSRRCSGTAGGRV